MFNRSSRWSLTCLLILSIIPAAVSAAPSPGDVLRFTVDTPEETYEVPWPDEEGYAGFTSQLPDGTVLAVHPQQHPNGDWTFTFRHDGESLEYPQLGAVLHAAEDEQFYGLMERVVDGGQDRSWREGMTEALDLRGQTMTMFVKPTVSLYAPFFVSTGGYGCYAEGWWPGAYDMAATDSSEIRFDFEGGELRFHLLYGTPLEVIAKYNKLVGMPILPPKWVFEPWRWRDDHTDSDTTFYDGTPYDRHFNPDVVEDVLMMDALGIPCGAYWVDRPWAKGFRGYEDFEWDPRRFPNAEEMVDWINDNGMEFLLWIAPWSVGDMVEEGRAKGYFLQHTNDDMRYGLLDYTNPEAVEWWQGYVKKVVDQNVAGFKLDRAEEIVPSSIDQRAHSGMTTRELHNGYPVLYAKAVHDLLKEERGDDFAVMPRAGYAGSQQYAIFWGGDTSGTEWGLRSAIIALQRAAVMGFHVWGADTGGYHHGYNRDTLGRWLAFSAFCPLMEVGPTANRGLWDVPWEPHYDAEMLAIWRHYAKVHEDLADYQHEYAKRAHTTGVPIVRPLAVQYPEDPKAAAHWDEYMLGEDILVAPLWKSGQREREVYLPAGQWVDAWSSEARVIAGPATVKVECPLYKIPLYKRAGSDVPLANLQAMYEESVKATAEEPEIGELVEKAGIGAN